MCAFHMRSIPLWQFVAVAQNTVLLTFAIDAVSVFAVVVIVFAVLATVAFAVLVTVSSAFLVTMTFIEAFVEAY